jgi:hypothetical protein
MASITMENTVGARVLIHLQPEAFLAMDIQGIEEPQFVARVLGYDNFGLWVENPNYCTTPTYTDEGEYIPPEQRSEVCHRAVTLLQWAQIQSILQFPDRPTFGATLNASEIGFRRQISKASTKARTRPVGRRSVAAAAGKITKSKGARRG